MDFHEWLVSPVGKTVALIVLCLCIFLYILAIIFEDKWGN